MINLPNFDNSFEYENNFYLSCSSIRIGKLLAHYELFKMTKHLEGAIVECGIFKGASFTRFAMLRQLTQNNQRKILGFDTFQKFPPAKFEPDKVLREQFTQSAGENSISVKQLKKILQYKGISKNFELIKGDIIKTIPEYIKKNPKQKFSLINLDVDLFEPSIIILKNLFPKLQKNGILILDDYGVFPGETKAVDEYFSDKNIKIKKFNFSTIHYIVKK